MAKLMKSLGTHLQNSYKVIWDDVMQYSGTPLRWTHWGSNFFLYKEVSFIQGFLKYDLSCKRNKQYITINADAVRTLTVT